MSNQKLIKLNNVRLSFPSLLEKAVYEGQRTKYEATFVIPKDNPAIPQIEELIETSLAAAKVKASQIKSDKTCYIDGDDEDQRPEYAGCYTFKGASKDRPKLINRMNQILDPEELLLSDTSPFYAGCVVNAVVGLWIQNNGYGKRINGNLYGVQFVEDAEPFGTVIDTSDMFEDLDI